MQWMLFDCPDNCPEIELKFGYAYETAVRLGNVESQGCIAESLRCIAETKSCIAETKSWKSRRAKVRKFGEQKSPEKFRSLQ